MATLEQLGNALKQADAAGDTASARILADAYRKEQARLAQAKASSAEPQVMAGKRGGMVEEGTISREDYMSQRGPVNEAYDPIPQPDRMYDTLKAEGIPFGNMRLFSGERRLPASGSIGMKVQKPDFGRNVLNKGVKPIDLGPQSVGVPEKSTFAQAGATGIVSIGRGFGALGDTLLENAPGSPARTWVKGYRAANEGRGPVEQGYTNLLDAPARALNGESWDDIRSTNTPLTDDWEALLGQSLEDRPVTTRAGQGVGLLVGGEAKLTDIAMREVPKLPGRLAPKFAALFRGNTMLAKAGRYGGRLGGLAAISEAGYQGFNYAAEAQNRAIETGEPVDRMGLMAEEIDNPVGWLALPALSVGYRGLRAPAAALKNTADATFAAAKGAAKPDVAAAGIGKLPEVQWRGGSFTPTDVQTRQALGMTADEVVSLRNQAIDELLKNGFEPDDAEIAVRLLSYNNMSEVPEALFEISPALQEIAVVAGRLHGKPAHKIFRQFFADRAEAMPEQLRTALRTAIRASGDDFEKFVAEMKQAGREAADPGYRAAHGTQITDETWDNILDLFGKQVYTSQTKSGKAVIKGEPITAARLGAELARTSARGRNDYFAAAAELESLALSLERGTLPNEKLSTIALDFLDRGIGRRVKTAVRKGDSDFASSLLDFRGSYRGSGLDADTGLNVPRTLYAQYKAVGRAAEFGEKAAGRTIPLRQMKQQFIAEMRNADEAFEAGIGEGSSIIDTALLQGWVRGAENAIDMAPNPKKVLTDLYGTPRQREKLLSMMRELDEGAGSGFKGDNTKRIKALVGSKPGRADYKPSFKLSSGKDPNLGNVEMPSLFDRQKNMLESERLVYGGSPTGGVNEAMANQLGRNKTVEGLYNMVEGIYRAPGRFIARQIDMRRIPLLRQDAASEEIGKLLTTSGRERLLSVIDEIRQRAIATGRIAGPDGAPPAPRTPPSGGSPAGPTRAGGFAGFPTGRFNKRPRSTPESMADHDEKLTNLFGGNPPPPRTPRDVEIERLSQVERDALAELDELDNRVVDMGVDPAILQERRILPSDVSPNAWPQVQEIMAQMDDAATRLMRARDEMSGLRNAPEGDAFGAPSPPKPTRSSGAGLIEGLKSDAGRFVSGFVLAQGAPMEDQGSLSANLQARAGLGATVGLTAVVSPRLAARFGTQAEADVAGAGFSASGRRVASGAEAAQPFHDPRLGKAGNNANKSVEMARNGVVNNDIAAALGIEPQTVAYYLTEARKLDIGVPHGARSGRTTMTGTSEDIARLKEQGLTNQQIAARTGKNISTVKSMWSQWQKKQAAQSLAENPIAGNGLGGRKPIRVTGMSQAEGNKHGLMPHLRMKATTKPEGKAKLVQDTNANNVERQLVELDNILKAHPDALDSPQKWARMMSDALASDDVPVAPYAFIRDMQDGTAQRTVQSLSPGQVADADHGFANAAKIKQAYFSGMAKPSDTGSLFAWGFLSRGVSPYTQESLFIDAFNGLGKWIDDAAAGRFDLNAYLKWSKTAAPKGSGQPGAGASHNLNAFGKLFLRRMSENMPGTNLTKMEYLHNLIADPTKTGPQIRREFARMGQGVGIDNKVVSFTLLVSGRDDVMVLDRVQVRKMWNDGRFKKLNLYDGFKQNKMAVTGSALSNLTYGARGLLVYEAIERHLAKNLRQIYAGSGRENQASIGRYHWETWVAESQQEASHGTLDAVLRRMMDDTDPMSGVVAKEGEYGSYAYGAQYGRDAANKPFIDYPTPSGATWRMTPTDFAAFRKAIKSGPAGVLPKGKFKVSDAGDQPWYNKEGVSIDALDDLASRYGTRIDDGSVSGIDGGAGQGKNAAAGRQADLPGSSGEGAKGQKRLPKGPIQANGFGGEIDFKAAGRRLRKGAGILDRKLAQPVTRGIQKLEQRLASVDDPRNYGPRMAQLGIPDNLDPSIPLFDQIADPAAAARILADNAAIKGGTEGGQRAISYVAGKRNQRLADAISNGDRSASVRQRQAAGQAYAKALKDVESFFGPNGDQRQFKTIAARRTEQARRLKVLREAGEKVGISKADQLSPQRPITQPDREDMIINAMQRAEKPPGYSTRNQMFAAVKTRAGNLDSRGRPRGSIAERPLALDREATRVEPAGQQMPVLPTQRARTGRDASAAVDNRTAQMLLDPEMATAGAYAARAGGAGFAPRPNLGRAVAALGAAGAGSAAVGGYMAVADKLRQNAENVRAAEEKRNRPVEHDPNRREPVSPRNPPPNWTRMSSNDRMRIQMTLNKENGFQMPTDYTWGGQMMRGIEEFQEREGLPVTGDLDDRTLKAINAAHYRHMMEFEYERRQSQPTQELQ